MVIAIEFGVIITSHNVLTLSTSTKRSKRWPLQTQESLLYSMWMELLPSHAEVSKLRRIWSSSFDMRADNESIVHNQSCIAV